MLFIFQYKEKRMEQEKGLLQGQVTWLNTELKAKSEELLSLSRQRGNEILELQCNLNNKEDEVLRGFCDLSYQYVWSALKCVMFLIYVC